MSLDKRSISLKSAVLLSWENRKNTTTHRFPWDLKFADYANKVFTAMKVPLDLMKFDSDAASLTWRPSNLSLDGSPIEIKD